ncbi:MAG: DUF2804 domain-containing protein [Deltaproteobacteria bacterium]|nr:DUF2804 domain-containing protein [Deltaproteobacteria bacterium]
MTCRLPSAPAALFTADGCLRDGVYCGSVADPDVGVRGPFDRLRRKEWHYLSVCTDRQFIAVAVVQLGYLANAFAYAVDLADPCGAPWRFEALRPLGVAVDFAPAADRGVTCWHSRGARIEITGDCRGWRVDLDVPLRRSAMQRPLRGQFTVQRAESLTLVHRLPTGKPAYTEKEAGLLAELALAFGDQRVAGPGLATSDWTRSVALRETRWKWASLVAHLPAGRRLGLNLSAEVYDDARGHGRENAVWIDGAVWPIGGVRFAVPADPERAPWRIDSLEDGAVDLRFEPMGARRQDLDFGAVASQFVQPFGRFFGRVVVAGNTVPIAGAVGVVENHRARW